MPSRARCPLPVVALTLAALLAIPSSAHAQAPSFVLMWGSSGSAAGQFSFAHHLTVSPTGEVYVGDLLNARVQEFAPDSTFLRQWVVTGADGIAAARDSTIYVVASNQIERFTRDGTLLTFWGGPGSGDGQFSSPIDVAVDADGNVYVAEAGNHRVQKFDANGAFLRTWGTEGSGDGQFEFPLGITVVTPGSRRSRTTAPS